MIFVIDKDARRREISEAILAKLRFAVAPFATADEAISAMRALRPEAVVAHQDAVATIRDHLASDLTGRVVSLLPVTDDLATPEALVEALRRLLQSKTSTG